MVEVNLGPPHRVADGAVRNPTTEPAAPAPPPPSAESALLAAHLRRSLGKSPQLDQAVGQLLSLLA